MNEIQKKYVVRTTWVFLLTIVLALKIRSRNGLYRLPIFYHLFVRYDLPGAILLIVILFAAIFLATRIKSSRADLCLDYINKNPVKISASVFVVLAVGAYFIYCRYPLCMDEYMPYFQARIFAEGKLWGQFPPKLVPWLLRPEFFSVFSAETGRVVSDYWPGFALLLTPFMKLGIPWMLNPIISAGTILLLFYYVRKILPDTVSAAWAVLLTISSSVFMVNGISYYSMSAHLFFNLLYAILLLEISPLRLFSAGLVGSFALVLSNPIPHIAFALPWIFWIALKKKRIRNIGILFAGYLPLSLIIGFGWVWLENFIANDRGGSAIAHQEIARLQLFQAKINAALFDSNHTVGFLLGKMHDLFKGVVQFPNRELLMARLMGCLKIFAWSIPGLPLLAVMGIRNAKCHPHLKLWGGAAALTLFFYLFVTYDQGHGWGYRYFHSVWLALPLMSAAFLTATKLREAAFWRGFICYASLLSLVLCSGLRFFQVHQFIEQHLSQLPIFEKNKKYICIIKSEEGYYSQDLIRNDPFLREPVMMLKSVNDHDDREILKSIFPKAINVKKSSSHAIWELRGDIGKAWTMQLEH
jgi:hypothetical protein